MSEHRPAIVAAASRHRIDPRLVEAIVAQESSGHPWAWNPEPAYRYLWDVRAWSPFRSLTAAEIASSLPPTDFPTLAGDRDQEWWGQRASWGLMQLMGAVGRERGFRGLYLPALCDVATNLDLGCRHLAILLSRHGGAYALALAAYNAGTPQSPAGQDYARKVLIRYEALARS